MQIPRCLALVVLALLLAPSLVTAQGPRILAFASFTANVTLTTTSETVIVSSPLTNVPRDEAAITVIAWAQLTTGAATTTVTPRIRRGTATSGTLVGEANAVTIGAAAGSTEQYVIAVTEERATSTLEYSLTLQQASATGDGTALQGAIVVLAR